MISSIPSLSTPAPKRSQGAPTPPPPPPDRYDPGFLEKGVTQLAGLATGAASSLISLVPSATTGATQGVNHANGWESLDIESATSIHAGVTAVCLTGVGLAAGSGLGVPALVAGGVAGLILGSGYALVQANSGGSQRISESGLKRVEQALSNNLPSGSAVKDRTKALVEGALSGAAAGSGAAFAVGREQGQGAVAGALEGAKEGARVLLGNLDLPPAPPGQQPTDSIGRRLLRGTFGVVGAGLGSSLSALDGALQGGGAGSDGVCEGSSEFHHFTVKAQTVLSGAVAGGLLLGPVGAFGGSLIGLGAGIVLSRIERNTGLDQKIVDSVQSQVKQALANDPVMDSQPATVSRNLVEGSIVGAAAGIRLGAIYGYQGGVGAADATYDVAAGFASAVHDIVLGPKS